MVTQQVCISNIHTQVDHLHLDTQQILRAAIAHKALYRNKGSAYSHGHSMLKFIFGHVLLSLH